MRNDEERKGGRMENGGAIKILKIYDYTGGCQPGEGRGHAAGMTDAVRTAISVCPSLFSSQLRDRYIQLSSGIDPQSRSLNCQLINMSGYCQPIHQSSCAQTSINITWSI